MSGQERHRVSIPPKSKHPAFSFEKRGASSPNVVLDNVTRIKSQVSARRERLRIRDAVDSCIQPTRLCPLLIVVSFRPKPVSSTALRECETRLNYEAIFRRYHGFAIGSERKLQKEVPVKFQFKRPDVVFRRLTVGVVLAPSSVIA